MFFSQIRCDVCGVVGAENAATAAQTLRLDLAEKGWRYHEKGGCDYCPLCIAPAKAGKYRRARVCPRPGVRRSDADDKRGS